MKQLNKLYKVKSLHKLLTRNCLYHNNKNSMDGFHKHFDNGYRPQEQPSAVPTTSHVSSELLMRNEQQPPLLCSTSFDGGVTLLVTPSTEIRCFFDNLYSLQTRGELCDIVIECEGKTISAHRVVLCASLEYFRMMFQSEMAEAKQPQIQIKEVTFAGLETVIKFAYTGSVQITPENVRDLLHTSNFLGELCVMSAFKQLDSVETLERLMADDNLNIRNERQLFDFARTWTEHDRVNRIADFARLMQHIRFFQLPLDFFLNEVRTNELVLGSERARELISQTTEALLKLISRRTLGDSFAGSLAGADFLGIDDAALCVALDAPLVRTRKAYAGTIFCVGGRGQKLDPFRSVEVYDWLRNRWLAGQQLNTGRRHVGVTSVAEKLFVVGGHDGNQHLSSVEYLDIRKGVWTEVAPLSIPRRGMAVVTLDKNCIFAIGGLDDQMCYSSVERYDLVRDEWVEAAEMGVRRGGVAVAIYKNQIYAVGGNNGTSSMDSCERYDPILNRWCDVAPMHNKRAGCGVAVVGDYLFAIGGFDDEAPLRNCERYSFERDEWTQIASLSCARGGVGVATMGGRVFAIGGHDSKTYLNTTEMFDPLIGVWVPTASISERRAGAGITWSSVCVRDVQI